METIAMYHAGLTPKTIAERTGASVNTIKAHIKRHKLSRNNSSEQEQPT
jgi:DNA-binding CsgD family transcriptional regulator